MSEHHDEGDAVSETADLDNPDARPSESYPNPTQERMDEERDEPETEGGPHEGEEGQRDEVA